MMRVLAGLSWVACVGVPFLFLHGQVSMAGYKAALAAASVAWFVFATAAVKK